jgi:hypothetical protein
MWAGTDSDWSLTMMNEGNSLPGEKMQTTALTEKESMHSITNLCQHIDCIELIKNMEQLGARSREI